MRFVLTGFTQENGYRVFAFEGIDSAQKRSPFIVRADLALVRSYGIHVQELPLLCRRMLDECDEADETRTFIFAEEKMRDYATTCAASRDAANRKRYWPPRKTATESADASTSPAKPAV